MAGNNEQRTYVIPSLDMVVVRLGYNGSREGDTRVSLWTGRAGEFDYEFLRLLMDAVTDADVPHAAPYAGSDLYLPPPDQGIVGDAWDTDEVLAGAGLGPNAPAGCTPAGCE